MTENKKNIIKTTGFAVAATATATAGYVLFNKPRKEMYKWRNTHNINGTHKKKYNSRCRANLAGVTYLCKYGKRKYPYYVDGGEEHPEETGFYIGGRYQVKSEEKQNI